MDALLEVEIAVARVPLAIDELTVGERVQLDRLSTACRRREWLTGRRALRFLLCRLGLPPDTSAVAFPNACLSLSHSAGVAVAAGVARRDVVGVGVDLETRPSFRPSAARFFLDDRERADAGSDPRDLVRLWTVKEALFKANVANAGTRLLDYSIGDVSAEHGRATGPPGCAPLRYLTTSTARGIVTIAVSQRGEPC